MRRPRVVDLAAVREQPAANNRFRKPRATLAGRRRSKVALPGKPFDVRLEWTCGSNEVEIRKLPHIRSHDQLSGE